MARHVPISEFKDHASELVAAAERGEEIIITRHGKPTVRLVATAATGNERRQKARAALARLAEIRAEQRELGMTSTIAEMIAWKNEGRR
ncbi:MAG: type II toxin-antitoxin system prevent-host-death family antitoxin [Novosphingobium sp.]